MTEGIIQKVFTKHYPNLTGAYSFNEQVYYFEELKKELIEEIKKVINDTERDYENTAPEILSKLIGDVK